MEKTGNIENTINITNAMEVISKGMPINMAPKTFGVPRTTLNKNSKTRPGPNSIFSKDEEDDLVRWIEDCYRRGFPKRKIDLQLSVANFIKLLGRKNPFKNGIPGNKWYDLFMCRHPELIEIISEPVTSSSATVPDKDIKGWFSKIEMYLMGYHCFEILHDSSRVFIGKDLNFRLCPKSGKVLSLRSDFEVDQATSKSSLIVLLTFGANGDITPPLVIFPYNRFPKDTNIGIPDEWGIGRSDSGLMKAEVFHDYIQNVFHPYLLKTKRTFPVIFFVDGQKIHLSIDASELCRSLGIVLVALYPNATRLLQSADVSPFRSLEVAWKDALLNWGKDHPFETLTKNKFVPVFKEALDNGIQPSMIVNVFRAIGLHPWNSDAISYKND